MAITVAVVALLSDNNETTVIPFGCTTLVQFELEENPTDTLLTKNQTIAERE